MVFYKDSLAVLHELTAVGKKRYQDMLEREADMILLKHQHFLRWLWLMIEDLLGLS